MRPVLVVLLAVLITSCWNRYPYEGDTYPNVKVWGSKPVYAPEPLAKQIQYLGQKQPLKVAGNVYALGSYIFQVDIGRGIHVIDNADPAKAERTGFIAVHGCTQLSIKDGYLYTNNLDDLVVLDLGTPGQVREVGRIKEAFPQFRYQHPLARPEEKGFYECPRYDSVVVGWVKDSIWAHCKL